MLRVAYHEAIESTDARIVRLGVLLVDSLHHALDAIRRAERVLAARIVAGGDQTADLSRQIESTCIELIWKQQPIAGELRGILAMFEVNRDLQRVDYYILDVAKHAVRLQGPPPDAIRAAVAEAFDVTERALGDAVEAYRTRDLAAAERVLGSEKVQDRVYEDGIKALNTAIRSDESSMSAATEMIFAVTALERIGDHAINIAWQAREMIAEAPPQAETEESAAT